MEEGGAKWWMGRGRGNWDKVEEAGEEGEVEEEER